MALPYFYSEALVSIGKTQFLNEETSKHLTQVLRKVTGDQLQLTDGRGAKAKATIVDDNRKKTEVKIETLEMQPKYPSRVCIAISLIKNASRFEWFLEKATEIGVTEIIPLVCERTEKEKLRVDRMTNIIISAMLQSQQCWLPRLWEPLSFQKIIDKKDEEKKFIAHCLPEQKVQLSSLSHHTSSIILIGPEGDFTENEINMAVGSGFQPVALGNTRLRSETAGIVAATLLCTGY
jgi:16S rRNA (uracil1498-N3)-methyltransferase